MIRVYLRSIFTGTKNATLRPTIACVENRCQSRQFHEIYFCRNDRIERPMDQDDRIKENSFNLSDESYRLSTLATLLRSPFKITRRNSRRDLHCVLDQDSGSDTPPSLVNRGKSFMYFAAAIIVSGQFARELMRLR